MQLNDSIILQLNNAIEQCNLTMQYNASLTGGVDLLTPKPPNRYSDPVHPPHLRNLRCIVDAGITRFARCPTPVAHRQSSTPSIERVPVLTTYRIVFSPTQNFAFVLMAP